MLSYSRFAHYFSEAAEHELLALTINEYAPLLVPGPMQTEDYAAAVFLGAQPLLSEEDLASRIAARLERAGKLIDPTERLLWYILDEAVLRRVVGTRAVMAGQLRHIVDLIETRKVIVQVVEFAAGAHALLEGMISLMTFADAPPLAYLEGPHAGQLVDDSRLVTACSRSYDLVRAAALSPEASLALIRSAAEDHHNAQR
ncbi:DUF5753 domain-containing protein [Kitasatospora sp. NBC_00070]